ncbi:hypothetical protein DTO195F2_7918 [Paecilomyces variotii]|nr:hypothetical protein DTO195F2_7918 [Paecilomyces variotii]KAJ9303954.1 hypothetical protein DTO217A2_6563 [Paecilomyces variotii]KAJ9395175.1 hypothetical protein DTO282F9_7910 [Paecilomyces variotii]
MRENAEELYGGARGRGRRGAGGRLAGRFDGLHDNEQHQRSVRAGVPWLHFFVTGQPTSAATLRLEKKEQSKGERELRGSLGLAYHLRQPHFARPSKDLFFSPTVVASAATEIMADSDEEYIGEITDDEEVGSHQVSRDTRSRKRQRGGAEWEVSRTWETLVEGADGTISSTVEGLLEAGKRKRLLRDTTPLQRGIIRHLILLLDLSQAMAEKDLRPTRYLLMIRYAQEFVVEFFEQNPISQLGILGMRDGLAVRISDLSGNPTEHISALQRLRAQDPKGLPSLQNGLEMARGALFHTPKHGTREVLIVFGALLSSDPGDIHQTINTLINDKIRVAVVGLAAQVAICRVLCAKTNSGDDTVYGVALNEQHFRELMMEVTTPPVQHSQKQAASSLLMMGFPSPYPQNAQHVVLHSFSPPILLDHTIIYSHS